MKTRIIILCCFAVQLASAQVTDRASLRDLIDAEKAFASMAEQKNTRDAFLFFFADDAVSASPGNGPISGKEHLEKQLPNESLLSWRPAFSDIATSGDFGYNTGPWEFRAKRGDTQPVAYGQFASMWKKDKDGRWKVAIDVGISHDRPAKALSYTTPSPAGIKEISSRSTPDKDALLSLENDFIDAFGQKGNAAYRNLASKEIKFFRSGREPLHTPDDVRQFLDRTNDHVSFSLKDGEVAPSGDLGYTYGRASLESMENGSPATTHHTYIRFWKKEDGEWKIVLDLISD